MKYWLLKPINENEGPWDPWYDACFGMVVSAYEESEARALASKEYRAEGSACWLDPELTSCVGLSTVKSAGVILQDVMHA